MRIEVEVKGKKVLLSEEEARKIHADLDRLFSQPAYWYPWYPSPWYNPAYYTPPMPYEVTTTTGTRIETICGPQ